MHQAPEKEEKRVDKRLVVALVIILLLLCLLLLSWCMRMPAGDTGSRIIPQGDMTTEEAQQMLDETVEKNRITVSLSPNPTLDESTGSLRINFIVVPDNNGYAERVEIEQDGSVVYASGIVQPGYKIEWADAPTAHEGAAVATVFAVDANGNDCGNPVSAEIVVTKA